MNKIHEYFIAERNQSFVFIILASAGLIFSFYFLILSNTFYNGLGWSLITFAIIKLITGVNKFYKTKNLDNKMMSFLKSSKKSIKNIEIPRIKKLSGNFKYYRYVEIVLILFGLLLFVFSNNSFWEGIGLGLIIECGILYIINYMGVYRNIEYLKFLKKNF